MASWCESINLTSCVWFTEGTERKRVFVSVVAGVLVNFLDVIVITYLVEHLHEVSKTAARYSLEKLASVFILFFIGWWLMIDADVVNSDLVKSSYYIWGTLGTISLIMVNSVTNQHISGSSLYDGGLIRGNTARGWLFVGFVLGFASVFGAVGVYWQGFRKPDKNKVPGVEILMQNILILFSSLVYKFFRQEDESYF